MRWRPGRRWRVSGRSRLRVRRPVGSVIPPRWVVVNVVSRHRRGVVRIPHVVPLHPVVIVPPRPIWVESVGRRRARAPTGGPGATRRSGPASRRTRASRRSGASMSRVRAASGRRRLMSPVIRAPGRAPLTGRGAPPGRSGASGSPELRTASQSIDLIMKCNSL